MVGVATAAAECISLEHWGPFETDAAATRLLPLGQHPYPSSCRTEQGGGEYVFQKMCQTQAAQHTCTWCSNEAQTHTTLQIPPSLLPPKTDSSIHQSNPPPQKRHGPHT